MILNKIKIVIIGCGNLSWHLASQLSKFKNNKLFIYNHQKNIELNNFNKKFKSNVFSSLDNIIIDADIYILCISDKFIASVSKKIIPQNKEALIMHCSGSISLNEIKSKTKNIAVFYPLQTFSKHDIVNWTNVPIIIESNNTIANNKVVGFANHFSDIRLSLNYTERLKFHLAAVFVNNFTNSLFVAALDLFSKKNQNNYLKFLFPLIKQTAQKIEKLTPRYSQTGPAKRNDKLTIKKHLNLLSNQSDLKKIYKQLSKLINKQQNK